jgi:predicted glutamine amidotransferase
MCGIILSNSKKLLTTKLYQQQHRGSKGAGFMAQKKIFKSSNIYEVVSKLPKKGIVAFHHRIPTSTTNTDETAHPFQHPVHKGWWGMHNGVIYNPEKVLQKMSKDYRSWWTGNDSEAITIEVINAIIKNGGKRKSDGYASVIIYDSNKDDWYLYRDSNQPDLYYQETEDGFIVSSESLDFGSKAFQVSANKVIKLSVFDGKLVMEELFKFAPPKGEIRHNYSLTGGKAYNYLPKLGWESYYQSYEDYGVVDDYNYNGEEELNLSPLKGLDSFITAQGLAYIGFPTEDLWITQNYFEILEKEGYSDEDLGIYISEEGLSKTFLQNQNEGNK